MIPRIWRLSEKSSDDNLGLACTEQGLVLGRTLLIERRNGRFVVREQSELECLFSLAYGREATAQRLMPGLATVASALNANDQALARIAAVHLRIPDVPDRAARDAMEVADILIKYARDEGGGADRDLPMQPREICKASPDDPKHPGWPAGTEGGRGGQFRPKDGSDAVIAQQAKDRITRIAVRRALRTAGLAILRIGAEAAANLIPGVDVVADVAMMADIAQTISEYRKLALDADAAIEFVRSGPHSLEELQVSGDYEEFSSYRDFVKDALHAEFMAKRFGPAGDGSQYHHIITQGGANASSIAPEQLQSTDNIIRLPTLLHEAVNAEYFRFNRTLGMTRFQWLQTQPYEVQREEGLKILRELNILK
jgi:hypothetical protein